MFISIDWLSFTIPMTYPEGQMMFDVWGRVGKSLEENFPLASQMLFARGEWRPRAGRAPYRQSLQRDDNGVMLFSSAGIDNALIEVSGIGCDSVGGIEAELALIQEVRNRVTRLDIAVDIFTEIMPDEFCEQRKQGTFKAWSEAVSASGHTCYIGSKSSDRYARIYRYFAPHPRSAFLRVEHVLKGEQARVAIDQIKSNGLDVFVSAIGKTFGWKHEVWSPAVNSDAAAKAWRPERRSGKTVAWIHSQVLPALIKLHREGIIDANELYWEFLKPELDKLQGQQ